MSNNLHGVGEQHPQPDPRGVLVFRGLTPELQASEDATQAADAERAKDLAATALGVVSFTRPSTAAEKALLAHLGYGPITDDLRTRVTYHSPGVRHRAFPQIGVH